MTKYIFIILLTLINFVYSQNRVCEFCNKEIEGRYIQVDNKYFHPQHFKCSKCGNLINGEFTSEGGKYYHKDCFYQEIGLKCAKCGKVITGKYYTANNKNYHPECLNKSQTTCDFCGKTIEGKYFIKDGKKYHPSCYDKNIALRCDVCLELLKGKYTIDNHGNKYHSFHVNNTPSCDNCGRIISKHTTSGGKVYNDGREICNLCYLKAVSGNQNVQRIYNKVANLLFSIGIKLDLENITIKPTDRNLLRNVAASNYSTAMKGYCKTLIKTMTIDNKKTVEKSFTVYVLDNVPEEYLASTIAHELMHVWLIQNTEDNHTSLLTEGSCNFTSYLYLERQNTLLSREVISALENDPDHIYGDGFRKVKRKFQSESVIHFLNYLKSHNSI